MTFLGYEEGRSNPCDHTSKKFKKKKNENTKYKLHVCELTKSVA